MTVCKSCSECGVADAGVTLGLGEHYDYGTVLMLLMLASKDVILITVDSLQRLRIRVMVKNERHILSHRISR